MNNHTATPWRLNSDGEPVGFDGTLCSDNEKANIEFCLLAVNSYDILIKKLNLACEVLRAHGETKTAIECERIIEKADTTKDFLKNHFSIIKIDGR